ncbi:hypothetical protein ACVWW7_004359 [Bradyrhizobium sp. LM6.9]
MPSTKGPRNTAWAFTEKANANDTTPFRSRMNSATETSVKKVQIESVCPHTAPLKITVGASQTAQKPRDARNGTFVACQTIWATAIAQPSSNTAEIIFRRESGSPSPSNRAAINRR